MEEVAFTRNEPIQTVRTPKEFEIVVHRGQVLRKLVAFFKVNPEVDFSSDVITATIVLPNGELVQAYDSRGVMRDLLTEFWDDFYERCTTGTNLKIPCLRHDMEAADLKAVGCHRSTMDGTENITHSISPKFLEVCPLWNCWRKIKGRISSIYSPKVRVGFFQVHLKTWKTSIWMNFLVFFLLMNAK